MIGLHPVHRRMAELTLEAQKRGSVLTLTAKEQEELVHCLRINLEIIRKLDSLKSLAFFAHSIGDDNWKQEIHGQIQEIESKMS